MSDSLGYDGESPDLPSQQVAREQEEIDSAYASFFSSPNGRIILLDLQREARQYQSTFALGDSHHSALLEGKRTLYLYILGKALLDDFQMIEIARTRAMRSTR